MRTRKTPAKIHSTQSAWARPRNVYLKGHALSHNAALRARYESKLRTLVAQMTEETERKVMRLFDSDLGEDYFEDQRQLAAMDASISSQAKILTNALTRRFQALFTERADALANGMVMHAAAISKTAIKSSIRELAENTALKMNFIPASVKEVSKSSVFENVKLIKSIPEQYFTQITGAVMRSITTGSGVNQLKKHFKKYEGMTDRRAKNIALDQTRKAYNVINAQRMMSVGYGDFEWLHSGGGMHPRPLHVAMNGKIYSFSDLPVIDSDTGETGLPGQAPGCGCTMRPVYKFPEDE